MEQNTQTSIKTEPELELDLLEILHLIRQYWLWIIEAGLCVGGICFLVCTLLIAPKYTASTEVYILHQQSDSHTITYSDLQTGTYLTDDYKELITSLPVLEKVIAQLDLDLTPAQFESRITVSTPEDTRIIRIEVEDEDPYQAHQIADTLRIAASAQIEQVMEIQAVKTVQEASYPTAKSGPARLRCTALGCLLGAITVTLLLILRHLLDDTIRTEEDVEEVLALFVLGRIPEINKAGERQ